MALFLEVVHQFTGDFQDQAPFSGSSTAQSMLSEPLGLALAACFERLACVYAKRAALHPYSSSFAIAGGGHMCTI